MILSPNDIPPLSRTARLASESTLIRDSDASAVPTRLQVVSDSVRRTLRPYYQQIVNRSLRAPWRNIARVPVSQRLVLFILLSRFSHL